MSTPDTPLIAALAHHYDDLVDVVRRRFGERIHAPDVVHDVCMRLLMRPPAETIREPEAFLRRLLAHAAIDRYRADSARERRFDAVEHVPEQLDMQSAPDLQLIFEQTVRALCALIQSLPPRCRDVFILHVLHDVPQAEIATRLGISRNMVTQHVSRAMRTLQPFLDQVATA